MLHIKDQRVISCQNFHIDAN